MGCLFGRICDGSSPMVKRGISIVRARLHILIFLLESDYNDSIKNKVYFNLIVSFSLKIVVVVVVVFVVILNVIVIIIIIIIRRYNRSPV